MEWVIGIFVALMIMGAIGNATEKEKQKKEQEENLRRRKEAEDYIMSSGDPDAIKMLMLARANPAHYNQVLTGGMNRGNSTLKTAMGVMAGVALGNMLSTAAAAGVVDQAVNGLTSDLNALDPASITPAALTDAGTAEATNAASSMAATPVADIGMDGTTPSAGEMCGDAGLDMGEGLGAEMGGSLADAGAEEGASGLGDLFASLFE
ncbi:MAG: hypothetical protein H7831_14495 [Magnetococcus sp. WYHC-3]